MKTEGIPLFEKREFSPKRNKYCICVFSIDEGRRLSGQLERMSALSGTIDVVVADGGSGDGSTNPEKIKKWGVNTLLTKKEAGGLGTQMRMAFSWAIGRGYSGIVAVDGNGKDGVVEGLPRFVSALDKGFDHVQGSRFMEGGRHENTPPMRLWALRLLHRPLLRLASGFPWTDTTNGFRAYSAKFLKNEEMGLFRDVFSGYALHYYLAVQAPKWGFRCVEVPVCRLYPKSKKIPTRISPFRGNLEILGELLSVCLGRYDPR